MELYDGQNLTLGPVWQFTTPSGASLPVSLLNFNSRIENKKIRLIWETASELNNDHFEIERSKDGAHFTKIGQVAGKGNSTSLQYYVFYDGQPLPGKIFYRLKQVDINAQGRYSKTVSIVFDNRRAFIAWPNPVDGSGIIQIQMENEVKGLLKIIVNDLAGREIYSEAKNNARDNFTIRPGLSAGTYTLTLASNDNTASQKIVVLNK
jgi:hypothetical protein